MTELLDQIQKALGDLFRIESELLGGGMSRLFIATESSLNRKVVVKVLPPEWTSDVSAARFKREMEFAAQLQHPHILPVLAAGAREDIMYYVMPYVDGESLRARLMRDGPFSVADAARILTEITDALAFAHGRGIIHRDIKPENILLEGRHAVLADFGVARAVLEARTGERLTNTGMSVGTPGYMSPEQVAGDQVDARADVYALAIVGYEMLAGHPPFSGSTAQAILTAHLTQPPPPLDSVRKDTPHQLSAAIQKALNKEPAKRFATAAEFGEAIAATATYESDARWMSRESKRLLIAVGLLLIAAAGGFAMMRSRARMASLVARTREAVDSGRYDEVVAVLDSAGARLDERGLSALAGKVGGRLAIVSDPPGAGVTLTRVQPLATFEKRRAIDLGRTPISPTLLVTGEYLVHMTRAGSEPLDLLADVPLGKEISVHRSLNSDSTRVGMSLVEAGMSPTGHQTDAFLIDQHEVTNAQYQKFVSAGGYRDPRFWPESLSIGLKRVPRDAALQKFLDKTGLPAPRQWSGAAFPEGKGDHPVVGVSWHEAAAYARWARKLLPTQDQWWRAALADGHDPYPWGRDGATVDLRANFGLVGTRPVGSYPAGVSAFGCYDMAGNVREWLADPVPGVNKYLVAGGSWQDPSYMFELSHSERFDPAYASDAIGFRLAQLVRK